MIAYLYKEFVALQVAEPRDPPTIATAFRLKHFYSLFIKYINY